MSPIFPKLQTDGFEQVVFFNDSTTKLRSIVAIHSTKLGPALGGCRFFPYTDEESALADVLNLAEAMTYKASLAGLPLGGGKGVIIGDPDRDKSEALWRAYGKCIDRLGGLYITTEDSGTSPTDMDVVRKVTKHVVGFAPKGGGSGDPSPMTALGVFEGIKAILKFTFGSDDLKGRRIAIQGVGHVGMPLARRLKAAGASLIVSDRNQLYLKTAVSELGAETVSPNDIFQVECDVFSPCAMGGVINEQTIDSLRCRIVAGAANNQLASETMGRKLLARGIAYAPDFAINAGGLINVHQEIVGYDAMKAEEKTRQIHSTILTILESAKRENTTTSSIALRLARERLNKPSS